MTFFSPASAPPVNVVATQSTSPTSVKISWSPPSDGDDIITGYRIFYGSGQSLLVPLYYVTSIVIHENPPGVGQTVSIRSESTQLPSKLINVTVNIAGRLGLLKLMIMLVYSMINIPSYILIIR